MSAPNKNYDPVEVTALTADEVERAVAEALAAIDGAKNLDQLKEARLAHAGDKAPLSLARAEIGALPPQARADAGRRVGAAVARVAGAIKERQQQLERERDEQVLVTERVDVTLPADRTPPGARHPVSMIADKLADVFVAMGYEVAEGPEVEAEWYNFDALNIPPDHPAREMQDTLFVAPPPGADRSGMVLRTHTSPVQIRSLLTRPLPLYVVSPGRVYRNEALDATHLPVFYQIEGLAVDEGLTMADLRGAIEAFVDALSGRAEDADAAGLIPVDRAVRRRVDGAPDLLGRVGQAVGRPGPGLPSTADRDCLRRHGDPRVPSPAASIPTGTAGSRSGWASSGRRRCRTASTRSGTPRTATCG